MDLAARSHSRASNHLGRLPTGKARWRWRGKKYRSIGRSTWEAPHRRVTRRARRRTDDQQIPLPPFSAPTILRFNDILCHLLHHHHLTPSRHV
jgi:hypothetical protein